MFLLRNAALEVVGTQSLTADLSPEVAWKMVICGSVTPTVEVNYTVEDYLATLHVKWYRLAQESNFLTNKILSLSVSPTRDL